MNDIQNEPKGDAVAAGDDASDTIKATLGLITPKAEENKRRNLIVATMATIALATLLLIMRSQSGEETVYETDPARIGDLNVVVTATGALEPVNQVEVGSEISGIVRSVDVDFNDIVQTGDVLAILDSDQLEARVRQARASLESAEASVEEAEATFSEAQARVNRTEQLLKDQHVSQQQLEIVETTAARASAGLAMAKAQLKVRRAALDADLTTLSKTTIRAPISGIVISRNIDAGQTVAASFQTPVLFILAENLTSMELHLDIDEADIGQVREGQEAMFSVDAFPERRFPARITSLRFAPQTLQGVVTYKALLSVQNPDLLLRPGMTATADINTDNRTDVLLVPNASLRIVPPGKETPETGNGENRTGEKRVWKVDGQELTSITVKTGVSDGRNTEIIGGYLEIGTPVLVDILDAKE